MRKIVNRLEKYIKEFIPPDEYKKAITILIIAYRIAHAYKVSLKELKNKKEPLERFKEIIDYFQPLPLLDKINPNLQAVEEVLKVALGGNSIVEANYKTANLIEYLSKRYHSLNKSKNLGSFLTPKDISQLLSELVLDPIKPNASIYDPTAGVGTLLTSAFEAIKETKPIIFGQEYDIESYLICKLNTELLPTTSSIKLGNTLTQDRFKGLTFDYMLANPPFGVNWSKEKEEIVKDSRFKAGLPKVNDGALLFILHLLSKMNQESKIGIILNEAPLYTGDAGSGENAIRRYIFESDLVEAIIRLPDLTFINTSLQPFIWILSKKKPPNRKNKIQLIDASELYRPLERPIYKKKREITSDHIKKIVNTYKNFQENGFSKILPTQKLGYRKITIESPLRLKLKITPQKLENLYKDEKVHLLKDSTLQKLKKLQGEIFLDIATFFSKLPPLNSSARSLLLKHLASEDPSASIVKIDGKPIADSKLKEYERMPIKADAKRYFKENIQPYAPYSWLDKTAIDPKDKQIGIVGYEVNFSRIFYTSPQKVESIEEIDKQLKTLIKKIENTNPNLNLLAKEIKELINE